MTVNRSPSLNVVTRPQNTRIVGRLPIRQESQIALTSPPGRQSRAEAPPRSPLSAALQRLASFGSTNALIPKLPYEIASEIVHMVEPQSAKKRAKLMEVNRAWLEEINRLSTHDPEVRNSTMRQQRAWCECRIEDLVDNPSLPARDVREGIASVLSKTPHVGIGIGEPDFQDGHTRKLENRRIALQELSRRTDMKTLQLDASWFTAASPEALVSAIGDIVDRNEDLEDVGLNLTSAGITDATVAPLLSSLRGKPVSTLLLGNNVLGGDGALEVAEHLPGIGLKKLDLSVCALDGAAAIELLGSVPPELRELSLDGNAIIDAHAGPIAEALATTNLETLSLRENYLGDELVAKLRAAQPTNSLGNPVRILG
jgi:hypothetical protein